MISVDEALDVVVAHAQRLAAEEIDFDSALGRVLREDVHADQDIPPFDRSAVDGFALRAADTESTPRRLRVVGTIAAGTHPSLRIAPGESAHIMTGAPVPEGADAVQMIELTRVLSGEVEIAASLSSGQNVAPRASEVRRGDPVLRAGARIDPAAIAVAATVGKTKIAVGRRPRVAIAATGDELVHPSETPPPGRIRNSNGFSLVAQTRAAGALPHYLGVARDEESSIAERVEQGLACDVLLLSGGVSMGRFDLVEKVLEEAGVELRIDAVALKPGKPLVFGTHSGGCLVFGLPGNPVSTMVTFELFVRPALALLEGSRSWQRPLLSAQLGAPLGSRGPRRAYLPGWVSARAPGEPLSAQPIQTRGSADIVAFAKANALLIVPEDRDRLEAGETVRVYPLDRFLFGPDPWRAES